MSRFDSLSMHICLHAGFLCFILWLMGEFFGDCLVVLEMFFWVLVMVLTSKACLEVCVCGVPVNDAPTQATGEAYALDCPLEYPFLLHTLFPAALNLLWDPGHFVMLVFGCSWHSATGLLSGLDECSSTFCCGHVDVIFGSFSMWCSVEAVRRWLVSSDTWEVYRSRHG